MFENCVFKVSVDTKKWMKKAGINDRHSNSTRAGGCETCDFGINSVRGSVFADKCGRITRM